MGLQPWYLESADGDAATDPDADDGVDDDVPQPEAPTELRATTQQPQPEDVLPNEAALLAPMALALLMVLAAQVMMMV